MGNFEAPTIADVTAFFAIMPVWRTVLEDPKMRDSLPKLARWADKMCENEELVAALGDLKIQKSKL